jgi:hypothetical protein
MARTELKIGAIVALPLLFAQNSAQDLRPCLPTGI